MDIDKKKRLRALAHHLKPVVMIGQAGLTETVMAEADLALTNHELIKIKIRSDRNERRSIMTKICSDLQAELVQSIGQVAVIFRQNPSASVSTSKKSKNAGQKLPSIR